MNQTELLHGAWFSPAGSKLVLEVTGTELTGTFQYHGDLETVPVHGSVACSKAHPHFRPVSFSASWPDTKGYGCSLTNYTGQYSNKNGKEMIEVIFLLVKEAEDTVLWESMHISSDVFMRLDSTLG